MRNVDQWKPTKFLPGASRGEWVPNPRHLAPGSFYIASLQIAAYQAVIKAHARGDILDCGCGHVPFYGIYKDLTASQTCIDWENTMHPNQFLDQVVDLNGDLPFPEATFDTVLLSDVLEHIAEPSHLLTEASRVLRPQGQLLLMVPFLYYVHEAPFDFYRYTEFCLRRLAEKAGFEVVELTPYGGYPDVLLDLLSKALATDARRAGWFMKAAKWFNGTDRYRRMQGSSRTYPLGYCLVARKRAEA